MDVSARMQRRAAVVKKHRATLHIRAILWHTFVRILVTTSAATSVDMFSHGHGYSNVIRPKTAKRKRIPWAMGLLAKATVEGTGRGERLRRFQPLDHPLLVEFFSVYFVAVSSTLWTTWSIIRMPRSVLLDPRHRSRPTAENSFHIRAQALYSILRAGSVFP
jgi:hypothetical protein